MRVLAINPNDAERYPRDSFEAMQERVREDGGWPMPYLRDETQEVARAYGAQTTPDVFVVDSEGKLRYRGAPDSDYGDPSQNADGCVAPSMRCWPAQTRPGGNEPVGCRSNGSSGSTDRQFAVRRQTAHRRQSHRAANGVTPTRRSAPRVTIRSCSILWAAGYPSPGLARYSRPM